MAQARFADPDGGEFQPRRRPPPRGGRRWCPWSTRAPPCCWCASTGPRSTATCSRSPPASATSTVSPSSCTARRELEEEVGMRAGRLEKLAEFYNSPGFCDEHSFVFMALDLEPCASSAQGVEEQHMTIERVSFDDVPALDRRAARSSTPSRSSACRSHGSRSPPEPRTVATGARSAQSRRSAGADRGVPLLAGGRAGAVGEHAGRLPARPGCVRRVPERAGRCASSG